LKNIHPELETIDKRQLPDIIKALPEHLQFRFIDKLAELVGPEVVASMRGNVESAAARLQAVTSGGNMCAEIQSNMAAICPFAAAAGGGGMPSSSSSSATTGSPAMPIGVPTTGDVPQDEEMKHTKQLAMSLMSNAVCSLLQIALQTRSNHPNMPAVSAILGAHGSNPESFQKQTCPMGLSYFLVPPGK